MVEYVDSNGQPPSELRMAWLCRQWGSLPDSGGIYDQDYSLLKRMTTLLNVYDALTTFRSRSGPEIHRMPLSERKIIGSLRREGFI